MTLAVTGDTITLDPPNLQQLDVLRLRAAAGVGNTANVHGMTPGRDGQKIRLIVAPENTSGNLTLINESPQAVPGTEFFFFGPGNDLVPPTNFDIVYDATSGLWWFPSVAVD